MVLPARSWCVMWFTGEAAAARLPTSSLAAARCCNPSIVIQAVLVAPLLLVLLLLPSLVLSKTSVGPSKPVC
jgi:hypothetical protein